MRQIRPRLLVLAGLAVLVIVATAAVLRAPIVTCRVLGWMHLGALGPACDAVASLDAGRHALERNAPREALEHLRAAARRAPTFAAVQLALGEAAETLGEYDEALAAYRATVRLAPGREAYLRLGGLAERVGRADEAIPALERADGSWLIHWRVAAEFGVRTALLCVVQRWPGVSRIWTDCPSLTIAGTRQAYHVSRDALPQEVFRILVETGRRDAALALATARGWRQPAVDYCGRVALPISRETAGLLAMLVQPAQADCLVPLAVQIADDGLPRLGRLMLLDRAQHSQDPAVRRRAEWALRHRLPHHEVAKLAESLNVTGYRLQHRHQSPEEAILAYRKAIAVDAAFSWPYHNIGRVHLQQNRDAEALEWTTRALAVNPDHWRAWKSHGAAAYGLKRYPEALSAWARALKIDPNDGETYADLGRALFKLGREAEGLRALEKAVRLDPSLEEERRFLEARVGRDVRQGPTPAAIVAPQRPAAVDPQSALARAQEAFAAGRYAEALAEARRAAEVAPTSLTAITARAAMAEFMGEFDEAQAAYTKAATLAPDDPGLLYRRASFAVRTGDYDAALQLLDRLFLAHPRRARWLFTWAPRMLQPWTLKAYPSLEHLVQVRIDILMEKGDLQQARAMARGAGLTRGEEATCAGARRHASGESSEQTFTAFRLAALGDPDAADCVWWYGQWLTDEGYARLARLMVEEAARVTPSQGNRDSAARYLRIRLGGGKEIPKRAEQLFQIAAQRYRRDGDVGGARRLFEEAIRLAPQFVRPHSYLARMALDEGDEAGAVGWLERAAAADPDSWRTRRNLGQLLERLERYPAAEAQLRRTVELFGDDVGGRLSLARVLYAQGKYEDYVDHTRVALNFAASFHENLPEVRAFVTKFERWGPGAALPPAPDPQLILGWNHD